MPIGRSHFITASEYILMQGKTFDRQVICIFKILVINLHFSEIEGLCMKSFMILV